MPNLKKLSFSYHDLMKYPKFKTTNYMESVCAMEGGSIELVPMN